jgi:membrane dipeptidase
MSACQPTEPRNPVVEKGPQTLHERTLTLDTHVDIPLNYMTEIDPGFQTDAQVDLPKMIAGGLDAAFFIVYTPQTEYIAASPEKTDYKAASIIAETRFRAIQKLLIEYPEQTALCITADEVREAIAKGKRAVLIGMENAFPLGPDLSKVDLWARRGVRYVGLTHFGHNQFGDSSNHKIEWGEAEALHGGLSKLGEGLVRKLNDVGVMVDVSHAAKSTMMQATKLSRVPVIASHSGVMGVAKSPRNLDDEQLLAIKANGGVVQLVALGVYVKNLSPEQEAYKLTVREQMGVSDDLDLLRMDEDQKAIYAKRLEPMYDMAPEASVSDFVDHIDYAVKVMGIDHVGIASDFDGGGGVIGWEDASKTPAVTDELERRGYSEEDIAKIWGGNLLRVMEAVEAGRRN